MKKAMALMALMTLMMACDYAEKKDLRIERESRTYRAAMADYKAGRLGSAIKGLEAVVREDPANASARFQLACLLQETKKDPLGAYCGYREYLMQHPESDKSKTASVRMALCEKEAAKMLAEKHGLLNADEMMKETEALRADLKAARTRVAALEKDLSVSQDRVRALSDEKGRLLSIVKAEGEESEKPESSAATTVKEAKDLLEEESEETDRVKLSGEIVALKDEEKDEVSAASLVLPEQTAEDREKREAAERAKEEAAKARSDAEPKHPATYVVQEGDTLYRIAARFYGTLHAWRKIKDANKAVISSDGRVRAGDTIRLP